MEIDISHNKGMNFWMETPKRWQSAIEKAIEEALGDGRAGDLPGAGKPLNLKRDPYTPAEMQMAYDIMQGNGIAPDWMVERQQLDEAEQKLRNRLAAARSFDDVRWQRLIREIEVAVKAHNDRVLTYNLKVPPQIGQRALFNLPHEIRRIRG